jgi:hypothetical protein
VRGALQRLKNRKAFTGNNTENICEKHRTKRNDGLLSFLKNRTRGFRRFRCYSPLFSVLFPVKAFAQFPEARIDGIAANPPAIHAGAGVIWPTGTYLRSGIVAAIGVSEHGISGRADLINRFHLDPFREHRWAPYAGGGITTRFDDNRKTRVYLLIIAGIDGPVRNGLSTSIEAGLGGGARLGVTLRKTKAERR